LAQKGEEDEDEENGVDFLTKPQPVSKAVNHQKDVVNNNVICKTEINNSRSNNFVVTSTNEML
jgi:hypothetical protein